MKRFALLMLATLLLCGCFGTPVATEVTVTAPPATEAPATPTATPTPSPTPTATLSPTPEPTATPTPSPTPTPEPITQEMLDRGMFDEYYDETLFIGDSIMRVFSRYCAAQGALGTAQYVGVGAMGYTIAAENRGDVNQPTFSYRGKVCSLTYLINEMGAKRVIIMLGINDVLNRHKAVDESLRTVIENIRTECPGVEIVIVSFLSASRSYCRENRSTDVKSFFAVRDALREVAESCGVDFVSFASEVLDEDGYLMDQYSTSNGFHLTPAGNAIWLNCMRRYAAEKMRPGAEFLPAVENETE